MSKHPDTILLVHKVPLERGQLSVRIVAVGARGWYVATSYDAPRRDSRVVPPLSPHEAALYAEALSVAAALIRRYRALGIPDDVRAMTWPARHAHALGKASDAPPAG